MNAESTSWIRSLSRIRRIHTELARSQPYRDDGLVPGPAASSAALERAEARLGVALPPSYREFLLRHNGWERFYDGASLLRAEELGQAKHLEGARSLLRASLPTRDGAAPRLLPFGIDSQMCSIFAFDVNVGSAEKPVVAWVREVGVRTSNFPDFMELLAEFSAAELHSSRQADAVNLMPDTASSAA